MANRPGLQPVRSRNSQIRAASAAGIRFGLRCGRLGWCCRHASTFGSSGES